MLSPDPGARRVSLQFQSSSRLLEVTPFSAQCPVLPDSCAMCRLAPVHWSAHSV